MFWLIFYMFIIFLTPLVLTNIFGSMLIIYVATQSWKKQLNMGNCIAKYKIGFGYYLVDKYIFYTTKFYSEVLLRICTCDKKFCFATLFQTINCKIMECMWLYYNLSNYIVKNTSNTLWNYYITDGKRDLQPLSVIVVYLLLDIKI